MQHMEQHMRNVSQASTDKTISVNYDLRWKTVGGNGEEGKQHGREGDGSH